MVSLASVAGAGNIATAGDGSGGGERRLSTIGRRDSKSCWSVDGSASMESVMMVVPSDSPVTLCGLQDTDGIQCAGCSGYYLDSTGQPVYGIDYVRYWDCCGASTESIESKVEQALELVKSHLMFAVREEMRALKDEMDDLIRKNERLELENRLLRAHASGDVLRQLGRQLDKLSGHR